MDFGWSAEEIHRSSEIQTHSRNVHHYTFRRMIARVTPEQRYQIGQLGAEIREDILPLGPYDIIIDGG